MRTLIVEDECTCARVLVRATEQFGDVTVVDSAEAGFVEFERAFQTDNPFDLLCLDVNLPGLDGIELLDEVRRVEEENGIVGADGVKVVMTTGEDNTETFVDAAEAGCTSYLIKPVDPKKLLSELRRLKLITEQNN